MERGGGVTVREPLRRLRKRCVMVYSGGGVRRRDDPSGSQGIRGLNPLSSTERETLGTLATAGVSVFLGSDGSQVSRPISAAFLIDSCLHAT
jgi:hypothetical protein